MMGPFLFSFILMLLTTIQHLVKRLQARVQEKQPLLPQKYESLSKQYLAIFLYTLYFLYYSLSTRILQNFSCESVKNSLVLKVLFSG